MREPLGALVPGPCPLEGKSFYLDKMKSQSCGVLANLIIRLGGKVEGFLYKDVNVVITGNRGALTATMASPGKVKGHRSPSEQTERRTNAATEPCAQRHGTPRTLACCSRGKALLEKVIRNNEQSQGGVLSCAARYWGVKIVSVDQFLKVVRNLSLHHSTHAHCRREEKNSRLHVIKAGSLKVEFVKVEDLRRKYRPLHGQSLDFPMLSYTRRFSPFENPAPVHPGKSIEYKFSKDKFGKSEPISNHNKPSAPSAKTSRKKKSLGFCECCQTKYRAQDEHLQSDVHLRFVEDVNNYAVVDQLVASMEEFFSGCQKPHVDTPMTRFSSRSEAPPSESVQQHGSEIEANQEAEPVSHMKVQEERVCDSSVPNQQLCVDSPISTSMESKFRDEKQNYILKFETGFPIPHPQAELILNNKHLDYTAPSPGEVSDSVKPNMLQQLSEISWRTLVSLNNARGSSTCLNLQHQEDTMHELPLSRLQEREHTLPGETTSDSPSFQSLPCLLPTKISDGVNPRKRSRLFTLSPRTSKLRRTNLWSDPSNHDSGVDLRFDPVEQSEVKGHTKVNECKLDEIAEHHPSPDSSLTNLVASQDGVSFRNDQQKEPVCPMYANNIACDVSSELGPPQLYPFFHDDVYQNRQFLDPPKLAPSVASSASVLSQPLSICIESALVPDIFSPASSESDWDSGLLSLLAPSVHLQPKGDGCELDLGLLLQRSYSGMQDGSYPSRLCAVLQPNMSSHNAFGDPKTIYRTMETMDRRIIQSLGV